MKRKSEWSFLIFAGDLFVIPLSYIAGHYIRFGNFAELSLKLPAAVLFFVTAGYLGVFYFFDLYQQEVHFFSLNFHIKFLSGVLAAFILVLALNYSLFLTPIGRGIAFWANLLILIVSYVWRIVCFRLFKHFSRPRTVVIIGANGAGFEMAAVLQSMPEEFAILGFLDEDEASLKALALQGNWKTVQRTETLLALAESSHVDLIVLASPGEESPRLSRDLLSARLKGIEVVDMRDLYQNLRKRIPIHHVTETWFLKAKGFDWSEKSLIFKVKRLMDIFFSSLLLLISLPLWPFVALAIKFTSRGPIFYAQKRVGKNDLEFSLYKFRSMIAQAETDEPLWAAANDRRITAVGRFLRKLHLDELPQLINVLKGEMSLVGPRPERPEFVEGFRQKISYYSLRHFLNPGLTGWAQVNFPYASSLEATVQKLEYDLYYIYHASLLFDLKILLKTAQNIILRKKHRAA